MLSLPGGISFDLKSEQAKTSCLSKGGTLRTKSPYKRGEGPKHPGCLQSIRPRTPAFFYVGQSGGRELPSQEPEGRDLRVPLAAFTTMWVKSVCRKRGGHTAPTA